jgi:multidrug efflux system outer membrane protein
MVGPNYKRPAVNAPASFRGAQGAAQQASFADLPWWEVFKDDTLQGLIRTALTNNYNLRIAITRVEQARALHERLDSREPAECGYRLGDELSPRSGMTIHRTPSRRRISV